MLTLETGDTRGRPGLLEAAVGLESGELGVCEEPRPGTRQGRKQIGDRERHRNGGSA